jgi:GNAT superfamily N-acetyltransferase
MSSQDSQGVVVVEAQVKTGLAADINAMIRSNLPAFMLWASPGNWRWHHIYQVSPDLQLAALDVDGALIGAINAVALPLSAPAQLEGQGYDSVLLNLKSQAGQAARCVCLLSLSIPPAQRKHGLAERLLAEVFSRARRLGVKHVVAPLRPTRKAQFPHVPMADYLGWRTEDGRAFDPWIRTHVALGGEVVGVARNSLVVRQPVSRWESFTGRPMRTPGAHVVDGALAPVQVDPNGVGTYREDNVWIVHTVGG